LLTVYGNRVALATPETRLAWIGALAVLALVAALSPPAARANGDPASDVLYSSSVFLPLASTPPAALRKQLSELLLTAFHRGNWMKVAVIGRRSDLGSIPSLWLHPVRYAHFLGLELACRFRGRLIVVMPNGIGLWHGGRPLQPDLALLGTIRIDAGVAGQMKAAITAVQRLARAPSGSSGSIPPGPPPPPGVPC
jgi:hypothetical protein